MDPLSTSTSVQLGGGGVSPLGPSSARSHSIYTCCTEILEQLRGIFETIDRQAAVFNRDLVISADELKSTVGLNGLQLSPVTPRYKRQGFEAPFHSKFMLSSIKKALSIIAFILFGYKSEGMKKAGLDQDPSPLIININVCQTKLQNVSREDKQSTLYAVMGIIVGLLDKGKKLPGQAQECAMGGFNLARSMMAHRIRLLVISTITLLTVFTSYSVLFKLGLLACAAYTIFMFVMYAKQVFDMSWNAQTLKGNIQLVKQLMDPLRN